MNPHYKITLPLCLLLLGGCASAPPSLPPVRRPPHMIPERPVRPLPPHHKKRPKKHEETRAGEAHRERHAGPSAAEPGKAGEAARAKPQRPVVLYANDASLAQQVTAALNNDPALRGSHIHARAYHGNIWLTGDVTNDAQKEKAVAIAGNVTGVKMVNDQLRAGK